ncbi:hypothetical protein ACFQ0M_26455 [Kitasatospora aburaviensis]
MDALLSTDHPLAGRDVLRPADLRAGVLRYPAAVDRLDFLTRFADRFGVDDRTGSTNLGLEHFVERVRTDPTCFSLLPADCPLPDLPVATDGRPGVRTVPLVDPTPLYAWSLVWREDDAQPHPGLERLLAAFGEEARRSRWLEYDPARDWLPGPDEDALGR